jgi:putative N6-adenine-specific DNA methylase
MRGSFVLRRAVVAAPGAEYYEPEMSQSHKLLRAFATTSPGLETVLADELGALAELGVSRVRRGRAGVGFEVDRIGLERVTMSLRTAHRVLWTLGEVAAADGERLYQEVKRLVRWHGLVPAQKTFAVFATSRDTPAFSDARYAGLKVKDAIVDAVRDATGERPSVAPDDPDVLVRVSIARGRGVVSLDAAGRTSLHARGYRIDAGEAPLRETLAAALPVLAQWQDGEALIDPLCGSGTIVIEAALRARAVLPGLVRQEFGFMRWPGYRAARVEAWRGEAKARTRARLDGVILGVEREPTLVAIARDNAARAGVSQDVRLVAGDARTMAGVGDVPSAGLIVTNPPWGERLGDRREVLALLEALAAHWRQRGGFRAAVLVPDGELARALRLTAQRTFPLEAGGREVMLVVGRL